MVSAGATERVVGGFEGKTSSVRYQRAGSKIGADDDRLVVLDMLKLLSL